MANDIVSHFENRQASIQGKAMIVGMSRDICAELYNSIIQLRPSWHHDDDDKGTIKVVITGSAADDAKLPPHIRSKKRRKDLAKRFKNADDTLKLVIVRDMWLTGFDAPSLHTMYIDKPMRGHGLMQAIARVNRVFKDKPGGLVVDYLGIADQLKQALQYYTEGDRNNTGIPTDAALAILQEKYEVVKAMYGSFNYSKFFNGTPGELEVLRKLIKDEIKMRSRKNLVQSRSFAAILEDTIKRYQNRSIETAQVLTELIELAKEIPQAQSRGENLGLTEDEVAFYDALEVNDSAVQVLGDETLKAIARELVQAVRRNVTIDWTVKESVRAKLRTIVKRLLRKYGYPPDKQEKATVTVLQQAELLCKDWAA
nr:MULTISPECIES: type I restriction enzyme endonuclease domain-containing protein [unclassified Coleofasciculus]